MYSSYSISFLLLKRFFRFYMFEGLFTCIDYGGFSIERLLYFPPAPGPPDFVLYIFCQYSSTKSYRILGISFRTMSWFTSAIKLYCRKEFGLSGLIKMYFMIMSST